MNLVTKPPPVLDTVHLERASGGAPELMRDLLDALRRDLPRLRARLQQAETDQDAQALGETAHRLRGMAAYTGARRLGTAAARLEHSVREGDPADMDSSLAGVYSEIEALNRTLAGEGSPPSEGMGS